MVRGRVRALTGVAMALSILGMTMSSVGHAGEPQATRSVVKNMRDIEPNSVRFAAIQGASERPIVVLLGGSKDIWPKIRDATRDAEAQGYPVRAIIIGPADADPSLEIYARNHHVTNPINPYTITRAELTELLRDVSREYYPR